MDQMLQTLKLTHGRCLSEVLNNWVTRFSVLIDKRSKVDWTNSPA